MKREVGGITDTKLSFHLSFINTDKPFEGITPSRASIEEQFARSMAAGNPGPTDADINGILAKRIADKMKLEEEVALMGTIAFRFLQERIGPDSWAAIESHPDYDACYNAPIKDALGVWKIIKKIHTATGAGIYSMTAADAELLEERWNSWRQNELSLSDFYSQFKDWLQSRKEAGLPDISPSSQVEKFYNKLNPVKFEEVKRNRKNAQAARKLSGAAAPDENLYDAYASVAEFQPAPMPAGLKSSTSVFAATVEEKAGATDASVSDMVTQAVMVALRNFSPGAGKSAARGGGKDSATSTGGAKASGETPFMFYGRPYTKSCPNPGCGGKHPYWMCTELTGRALSADLQAKNDAHLRSKQAKAADTAGSDKVMVAIPSFSAGDLDDDEDDQYVLGRYFVATMWTSEEVDSGSPFDDNHVIYDTQAGTGLVKNRSLLTDIRPLPKPKVIGGVAGTKGGVLTAYEDGQLGDLGRVPFCPEAAANIIADADCIRWG